MTEQTVTIIVAVVAALGSTMTALIGWLAKRGVNYLDEKTKVLDEASEIQRKEAIKNKIVDTVTLVARSTMQTYVDEIKGMKEGLPANARQVHRAAAPRRDRGRSRRARDRGRGRGRQDQVGKKTARRGHGLSGLAPKIADKAGALLGLERKQGVLITRGVPEPSLALELFETKGKNWLASGWSLDAITTTDRGGLGIAKDMFENDGIEVDLGAYVTQGYREMFQGEFDPALGVGLSVRF